MPVGNYRPRNVTLQAIQFTGTNAGDCASFVDNPHSHERAYPSDRFVFYDEQQVQFSVPRGYWILRGVTGKLWTERDSYFRERYEEVS